MNAKQLTCPAQQQLLQLLASAIALPSCLLLLFFWGRAGLMVSTLACMMGLALIWWQAGQTRKILQQMQFEKQEQETHSQDAQAQLQQLRQQLQQVEGELEQQRRSQQEIQAWHQRQLQESNARLERMTAQVPGALFQLKYLENGKICLPYASSVIQDLFGLPAAQLQHDAQALLNLVHADDLPILQAALQQPEQALQIDLRVHLQHGLVWRSCHARAQVQADGQTLWHGIFMDVTLRQQQADAIRAANDRADAASAAKSAYLSNMTHEIRTPMNIILGMSYLALETTLEPGQRDYLDNIRLSAEHLLSLLNDILDLSKIEAGQLEVESIDFDLQETIAKLSKLMKSKIIDKGLAFELEISSATPLAVRGDPVRLSQVLINFIGNAIKFTSQGKISLKVFCHQQTEEDALLGFEVQDTGIGMSEAECSRMFQHFQQADSSISRKYGGTGLGLAISKQLVELMGGTVGLESVPGQGSCFKFSIKVQKNLQANQTNREQTAQAAQAAAAAAKAAMQGRRILLVEDQPLNQRVAQTMLKNAGATVELAENGQLALDMLRHSTFDCILMDMQMPVMDGVAATRAIRDDPALANNLVIAMTANASMHNQALCMAAGMNDFITKPIKPALLYAALAKWLNNPQHMQAARHNENSLQEASDSFNLSRLSQLVGNDPAVLRKFALMFMDTLEQTMAEMEQALQNGDYVLLKTLAQSLHSESSSMDAMEFAQLCLELTRLPDSGHRQQASEIIARMRPLANQIDRHIASLPE